MVLSYLNVYQQFDVFFFLTFSIVCRYGGWLQSRYLTSFTARSRIFGRTAFYCGKFLRWVSKSDDIIKMSAFICSIMSNFCVDRNATQRLI